MNRCGSTCGYRWVWRRWRPAASHGWAPRPRSLKNGLVVAAILVAVSIPIMIYIYAVVWTRPKEWDEAYHLARYRWLGRELIVATARTAILAISACLVTCAAAAVHPARRARRAAILPILVLADLLTAHCFDFPTVDPSFWTVPPASVQRLKSSPN